MRLSELKKGEKGIILRVHGHSLLRKRLSELGFVSGKTIETIRFAPLGDSVVYKILDSEISIRLATASLIEITLPK